MGIILDTDGKVLLNNFPFSPFIGGNRVIECNRASGIIASDAQTAHVAFDSNGNNLFISIGGNKWVKGSAIDNDNDVYYLATSSGSAGVEKFSIWGKLLDTFGTLSCTGVDVDGDGNVYVSHVRTGDKSVTKYNSSGVQQWQYDTGANANDIAVSSGGGFIAVAGQHNNNESVWVLDSGGGLVWTYDLGAFTLAICIDAVGNVYVTINNEYLKFDSSGVIVWRMNVSNLDWYGRFWESDHEYLENDRVREIGINWWARRDHNSGDGSVTKPNTGSNYAFYWEVRATIDTTPPYRACAVDYLRAYVGYSSGVACCDLDKLDETDFDPKISLSWGVSTGEVHDLAQDGAANIYVANRLVAFGATKRLNPNNGSEDWESALMENAETIAVEGDPARLWACNIDYKAAEIAMHDDEVYECIQDHHSCGDQLWEIGDWTIGDRVFYPTQNENSTWILTNSNKTSSDISPPGTDADWVSDDDEPGVGNAWTDYWVIGAE